MLCPKCGTANPENAANCSSCGSVLATADAPAAAQETAKKRKLLPWILGGVVVVVAALLILWFGGVFGGGIHSEPEKAALSFLENYYAADYDKMCEAIYPAIINGEFEASFTQIMADFEAHDFTVSDFTVADKQSGDSAECAHWEQYMADECGVQVEVSQLCYVTVEYVFRGTDDEGTAHETATSAVVAAAQIDGAWYVVNGDESKTYGFDTPEEAALTFYEGFFSFDYDWMSSSFYPGVDVEQTRAGFEEVVELMAAEDCVCSNFTVTSKEERSSADCAEWEQRLKEEYGFEVTISELVYVEVAYDMVGTVGGEAVDETVSAFLPVVRIDGIWYVIDGAV